MNTSRYHTTINRATKKHTVEPGDTIAVLINHGTASPIKISKTFEPIELDTAMSPRPKKEEENIFENKEYPFVCIYLLFRIIIGLQNYLSDCFFLNSLSSNDFA